MKMKNKYVKFGLTIICVASLIQPVLSMPRASKPTLASKAYRFDTKGVQLTGYIIKKMFPGAPNYESIKQGDTPREIWLFRLAKPITVIADPTDPFSQTERNVSEIQLILNESQFKKYRKFVGARRLVVLKCELIHQMTKYHYTRVLANVLPPKPVPGEQQVAQVKPKATTQLKMSGEPIRAVVGVLGTADVDLNDEARKQPGVYNARYFSGLFIKYLKATKDINKGLLNIRYYDPGNPDRGNKYDRFVIRLFDDNGSYLTHFSTTELLTIPKGGSLKTWAGYVNFSFQVNVRDLRDAKTVEFGFAPSN